MEWRLLPSKELDIYDEFSIFNMTDLGDNWLSVHLQGSV